MLSRSHEPQPPEHRYVHQGPQLHPFHRVRCIRASLALETLETLRRRWKRYVKPLSQILGQPKNCRETDGT